MTIRSGCFHGIGDRKRALLAKHCGEALLTGPLHTEFKRYRKIADRICRRRDG